MRQIKQHKPSDTAKGHPEAPGFLGLSRYGGLFALDNASDVLATAGQPKDESRPDRRLLRTEQRRGDDG